MSQSCYIVTGAGGSIGHAITEELARQGKWVIMACRNLQKDTPLRDRLNSLYNGRVSIMQLDSLRSTTSPHLPVAYTTKASRYKHSSTMPGSCASTSPLPAMDTKPL